MCQSQGCLRAIQLEAVPKTSFKTTSFCLDDVLLYECTKSFTLLFEDFGVGKLYLSSLAGSSL